MSTFTVVAVSDRIREWKSEKAGEMRSYRMTLKAADGSTVDNVEWARKVTSAGPTVGQQLDGELDTSGQYGPKFKPTQQQGGGGGGGGGYRPRPPEETAQIQRQHSQEMALRYAAIKAALGQLPPEFKPGEHLKPLIDWFDNDLAETKARVLAGARPPATTPAQGHTPPPPTTQGGQQHGSSDSGSPPDDGYTY